MIQVKAVIGKMTGIALVRDKDGNPKIDPEGLEKFWPYLSEQDKDYLKIQYEEVRSWP